MSGLRGPGIHELTAQTLVDGWPQAGRDGEKFLPTSSSARPTRRLRLRGPKRCAANQRPAGRRRSSFGIEGSLGIDALNGGAGNDQFRYELDDLSDPGLLGGDTIAGFEVGKDTVNAPSASHRPTRSATDTWSLRSAAATPTSGSTAMAAQTAS
jgi:hypothetical protein